MTCSPTLTFPSVTFEERKIAEYFLYVSELSFLSLSSGSTAEKKKSQCILGGFLDDKESHLFPLNKSITRSK